ATGRSAAPGAPALAVEHLSAPPAVRDASFELRRGEVFGIAGLIGSGRTSMIRALLGLLPLGAGRVVIGGEPLGNLTPSALIARSVGYLSEDRKGEGLALDLSLADNVTLTRFSACSRFGFIDRALQAEQVTSWALKLAIKARDAQSRVGTLSGGNQQKV